MQIGHVALIKYFVDCQNNKCEPLVAIIFGSGIEPLMAIDCTWKIFYIIFGPLNLIKLILSEFALPPNKC